MKHPFVFTLIALLAVQQTFAQPKPKQKATIIYSDGIHMGIPNQYYENHLDDSLIKWFGKKKADYIKEHVEVNGWPQSALQSLFDLDSNKYGAYFKNIRAWRIATLGKTNSLLEIRPEDNSFLKDTSFRQPFYLYYENNNYLSFGKWPDISTGSQPPAGSDDMTVRKTFAAGIKKKYVTPERKLRTEYLDAVIKGSQEITLETEFDEKEKRILVVMVNGTDQKLVLEYVNNGDNDATSIRPATTENFNGYTVSRFSFYNSSKEVYLHNDNKLDGTYTILLLSEKNDKAWAEYKKTADAIQKESKEREAETNAQKAGQYAREYSDARDRIVKIRNKVDLFIRETEWVLDYMNSNAESRNWGWKEYNQYLDKVKSAYSDVIDAYNSNNQGFSKSNPNAQRVQDWFSNISAQNKNIQDEINRLNEVNSNSKSPSLYSFQSAFRNLVSYGKKIYDKDY